MRLLQVFLLFCFSFKLCAETAEDNKSKSKLF